VRNNSEGRIWQSRFVCLPSEQENFWETITNVAARGDKLEKCLTTFFTRDANMRAQEMYLFASLFISGLLVNFSPRLFVKIRLPSNSAEREKA